MIPLLDEGFFSWRVTPAEMDSLWAQGWRHFGPMFYRYARANQGGQILDVRPLRLPLSLYLPTRSQRRILRRNADATVQIRPTVLDDTRRRLFQAHKARFRDNVPDALEDFLGPEPSRGPCLNVEISIHVQGRLVAASYLDVGSRAVSSVYAFFDPAESRRSLGIFTMLQEIAWARSRNCQYYYPGYAYAQPSHYDYKKQFHGLEVYDWRTWQAAVPGLTI